MLQRLREVIPDIIPGVNISNKDRFDDFLQIGREGTSNTVKLEEIGDFKFRLSKTSASGFEGSKVMEFKNEHEVVSFLIPYIQQLFDGVKRV
jgi:hypothetical protein